MAIPLITKLPLSRLFFNPTDKKETKRVSCWQLKNTSDTIQVPVGGQVLTL